MNKKLYPTCGILLTVLLIALVCSYVPFLKTNEGFEEGATDGNTTSQGATIASSHLQGTTVSTQTSLITYANRLKNRTNTRFPTVTCDDKIKFTENIKDIVTNT